MRHNLSFVTAFLFILVFQLPMKSIAQTWQWARHSNQSSNGIMLMEAGPTCVDSKGNVYVAGQAPSNWCSFGADTLFNQDSSTSGLMIFLVKYDSLGNVIWAKGGSPGCQGFSASLAADDSGNIYYGGIFYGSSVTFGTHTLTNTGGGGGSMFLVKYNGVGNVLWAKTANGWADVTDIDVDIHGNVFLTGNVVGYNFSLDTFTFTNSNFPMRDIYIAKLTAGGNTQWMKVLGGSLQEDAVSVSSDGAGNAYLYGDYRSASVTIGATTLTNSMPTVTSKFLAKYTPSGSVIWARMLPVKDSFYASEAMVSDLEGTVYITGAYVNDTLTLGSHFIVNNGAAGSLDMFLVKIDSSGNPQWLKGGGGPGMNNGFDLALDIQGHIWVTGGFATDSMVLDGKTLVAGVTYPDNAFLAEFDQSGVLRWAQAFTGGGDDFLGVASDWIGNVYLGGDYIFYPPIFGTDTLPVIGNENMFVAKLAHNVTQVNIISREIDVSIYPNPADDILIVSCKGIVPDNASAAIYDMTGTLVSKVPINQYVTSISTAGLRAGIYICKVMIDGAVSVHKMLIMH